METDNRREISVWLRREYTSQREKNPSFSQRAFSRLIGVSPGRLSELLAGKRGLSPEVGVRISHKLRYAAEDHDRFMRLIQGEKAKRNRTRILWELAKPSIENDGYIEVTEKTLSSISDWYYLALLNLVELKSFRPGVQAISARLGISSAEARLAWRRLQELGLVRKEGRAWRRVYARLKTKSDVPSPALRRAHAQFLQKAIHSLDNIPVEERDISSVTMAVDASKLPIAKKIIRNFKRDIGELLEEGERNSVYHLCVTLFP